MSMAPVYSNSLDSKADSAPTEAHFSVLTKAGESLFMCSSKEGHTCYHACRGHGRYPLWSDEEFMVDDVDEEEEEDGDEQEKKGRDESSSECDFDSENEWLSDDENDAEFWTQIQESVQRQREQRRRVHYTATDLRFLLAENQQGSAAPSATTGSEGPIVGVITSKPPPEYVWYLTDDTESWMRGSLPERLSQEPDGAYHRYRYHVWDRIPVEDVHDSDSDDDEDDEQFADADNEGRSWSELADQQEEQLQSHQS